MAHTVILQQCLHGYSDGHRLLKSSPIKLMARDQRTMLILSDASGTNASIPKEGYLTGYPLHDSGYYVVSRTWVASNVGRPGCVWTHSILIRLSDLAKFEKLEVVLQFHRQPKTANLYLDYDGVLEATLDKVCPIRIALTNALLEETGKLIGAIYEHPLERVIAPANKLSQASVFLIWNQQWPALRKNFRFCTLSYSDRSSDSASFDIQFIPPNEKHILGRFLKTKEVEKLEIRGGEWLSDAVNDIAAGSEGELRSFFRTLPGISGSRNFFIPLCKLFRLYQGSDLTSAIDHMIFIIKNELDAKSAAPLLADLSQTIARNYSVASEKALAFALENISLIENEERINLGKEIWLRDARKITDLLLPNQSDLYRAYGKSVIESLSIDELVVGAKIEPSVLQYVYSITSDVFTSPDIWKLKGPWAEFIVAEISKTDRIEKVLIAIMEADRSDLAYITTETFGAITILQVLDQVLTNDIFLSSSSLAEWLSVSLQKPEAAKVFLTKKGSGNRKIMFAIAHHTHPDYIDGNPLDNDPWFTALQLRTTELPLTAREYLAGYLLSRAFGNCSSNPLELITWSLDVIYDACLKSRLNEEVWSLVMGRLPRPSWWQEWDRCERLRLGVAEIFLKKRFSARFFCDVTTNLHLFKQLSQLVYSDGKSGRAFISEVKSFLKNRKSHDDISKLKIVESLR